MSQTSTITPYGLQRITEALQSGTPVSITHIAVGSGAPTASGLSDERHQQPVSSVEIDPGNPTQIIVKATIPTNVGGWSISEIAVLDDTGEAISVAPGSGYPKPGPDSAAAEEYNITYIMQVSNTAAITVMPPGSSGGNYLPLAGGEMEPLAEVKLLDRGITGPATRGISFDRNGFGAVYAAGQQKRSSLLDGRSLTFYPNGNHQDTEGTLCIQYESGTYNHPGGTTVSGRLRVRIMDGHGNWQYSYIPLEPA